jgi:hypothetical protein
MRRAYVNRDETTIEDLPGGEARQQLLAPFDPLYRQIEAEHSKQ